MSEIDRANSSGIRCISGTSEPPPPTANIDRTANCKNSAASVAGSLRIGASPSKTDAHRHDHLQPQGKTETQHPPGHKRRQRGGPGPPQPEPTAPPTLLQPQ